MIFAYLVQIIFQLKAVGLHSWRPSQVLERYTIEINFCIALITASARNISVTGAPPPIGFNKFVVVAGR